MLKTEELDKLDDIYFAVAEFLSWLSDHKELSVGEWMTLNDDGQPRIEPRLMPVMRSQDSILAEYFGIDLKKVEAERRALLESIRSE